MWYGEEGTFILTKGSSLWVPAPPTAVACWWCGAVCRAGAAEPLPLPLPPLLPPPLRLSVRVGWVGGLDKPNGWILSQWST